MKKQYSTPDIVFESFSLTTSIAQCPIQTNFVEGTCGYQIYPGFTIFKLGIDACIQQIQGDVYGDQICYHNPSGMLNLFNS